MFTVRNKDERGTTEMDWLESRHSFSFADYHDPAHMGFGPLRVINEDWIAAGGGFGTHGHKNMEIITYILSGTLSHKDNTGKEAAVITPGEVQVMSAGKGILHSEFNASKTEKVHLLQIWIMPSVVNTAPGYVQKAFAPQDMKNSFRLIVANEAATEDVLPIKQDAKLYAGRFDAGVAQKIQLKKDRKYWLQIAQGSLTLSRGAASVTEGRTLVAGDALAVEKETGELDLKTIAAAEVLLFDLPA